MSNKTPLVGLLKYSIGGNVVFKLQSAGPVGYKYWYPSQALGRFGIDIIDNVKLFQDGIYKNAAKYQKQYGIDSNTYGRLGKLAVALMGRESGFSNFQNWKGGVPVEVIAGAKNVKEFFRQAGNFITGKEVGWNPQEVSLGSSQIKFPSAGSKLRKIYDAEGITADSIRGGNYENQGKASILQLIHLYNTYKNDINAGIFRDSKTRASGVSDDADLAYRKKLYARYKDESKRGTLASGLYLEPTTSKDEYWKRKPLEMETVLGQLWNGVSGEGIFNMSANGKYTTGLHRILNDLTTNKPSSPNYVNNVIPARKELGGSLLLQCRNGGALYMAKGGTSFADTGRVEAVQNFLISQGYNVGRAGADGKLGNDTRNAIIAFQKANGLTPDGKWGKNTQDKAVQKYGNSAPKITVALGERVGIQSKNSTVSTSAPASPASPAKPSVKSPATQPATKATVVNTIYKTAIPELQALNTKQIQALNKYYGLTGNTVTKELENKLVADMYRGLTGYSLDHLGFTEDSVKNACASYVHNQIRYSLGRGRATGREAQRQKGLSIGNDLGIKLDAWDHGALIVKRGGTKLFDLYDDPSIIALGTTATKPQIQQAVEKLWGKTWSPRISDLRIGDVVDLYYRDSDKYGQAIQDSGRVRNTHTGLIVGRDKDGNPIVSHNIHGTIYNEVLKKGTTRGGFVTGAYRPKYGKYGFLSALEQGGRLPIPPVIKHNCLLKYS